MKPIYEKLIRSRDKTKDHRQIVKRALGSNSEGRGKKGTKMASRPKHSVYKAR